MANSRRSFPGEAESRERDELLATKLVVPPPHPGHLDRPRLVAALDAGVAQGVVVVCTPAGFGKTTLVAEWAAGARLPVAWVSLDPEDSDPVRFWRYVLVALERACEGLGERVLPLLRGPGGGPIQRVVTALVNELAAAGEEFALVLDDYHLVASQAVHDAMAFLLAHRPPRLHVLIVSRTDPPLSLARLRATGRLAELGTGELQFTAAESAALLRGTWDLELAPDVVTALVSRTEGWAVGLQLAALSLREHPDPHALLAAFAGTHRYVLDYLSEEVLDRQPERVRTFLLHCSVLRRLSGPLCDAVTGGSGGQELLEEIDRAGLFLFPLDQERRWYRFHQLFSDVLRARLHRADAGRVPELHRRAAVWCERHGLIDEAIGHAVAAGDPAWAIGLVEQHADEVLGRGESTVLERWLSALPDEEVRVRPALRFAQGELQFHLGRLGAAERLLAQAERALGHAEGWQEHEATTHAGMVAELPAAIALLRAELAGARGDAEGMAGHARAALALMREDEYGPRFWARFLSGAGADWMSGRLAEAEPAAAALLAEGRAAGAASPLVTSCFAVASVQQERGRLGAALSTYRHSLRRATEPGHFSAFHAAEAHLGIAQVLYERDQLDDALRHVTESIELGRQAIWFFEPGRRLVRLAWIRHAMGDGEGAREAMDEACRLQPTSEVNSRWNPAPCERARLLLAQGHVEEAARWVEERGVSEQDVVSHPREPDHLVLARVLLAQGEAARALQLLDRLCESAGSQGRTESLVLIRALRALALQAAGDHPAALALLADALARAQPEGYVRIFADEGPPLAALLRSLASARRQGHAAALSGATRAHLHRVLQASRHAPPAGRARPANPAAPGLADLLTGRELEVLAFIATGRRNHEIALKLGVTPETVKRHVSNILGKLGASSRTQAAARARELGLIE